MVGLLADIAPTGPFGISRPANEVIVFALLLAGAVLLGVFVGRRLTRNRAEG